MGLFESGGVNAMDVEDAILGLGFTAASAVQFVPNTSVTFYGESLGGIAFLISLIALGVAYATNEPDLQDLDEIETAAVVGTAAVILGNEYVTGISDFIMGSDATMIGAFAVTFAGFYVMSYRG